MGFFTIDEMTLEAPFRNFYDSDFDSRNESNIFEDNSNFLNLAFIASPESSNSFVYTDASLSNLANSGYLKNDGEIGVSVAKRKLMPRFGDLYSEIENFEYSKYFETTDLLKNKGEKPESVFTSTSIDELQKSSQEYNWGKFDVQYNRDDASENTEQIADLFKKKEEKLECVFSSTCLNEFQKSPEKYNWGKFDKLCNQVNESENTGETTVLSKKRKEKPDCISTSPCTGEFENLSKEYDWSKFDAQSNEDDASEKLESKIRVPISRFNYTPHELSTILEVDSLLMNESVEPMKNLDKYGSLFKLDSKNTNILETCDYLEVFNSPKTSPNFPINVIKVIQNKHIEKFLQEPGILEESDLTLISTDFDSTCNISEKPTEQSYSHGYYKIKRSNVEESPSLISFLQHELSCMNNCTDE